MTVAEALDAAATVAATAGALAAIAEAFAAASEVVQVAAELPVVHRPNVKFTRICLAFCNSNELKRGVQHIMQQNSFCNVNLNVRLIVSTYLFL